ncbi:MAG: DNA-binding protein [Alphaproteobacteria bacterium]|nr:DNA-binding protein [Alphaproteobacteria bacterium]MCL2504816.1 DNA-binding protein [Alphaproteobacteria bacterium]
MQNTKQYLTRREAANYITSKGLSISYRTLSKYATVGGSPVYHLFGKKRVVYTTESLDAWINARLSKPLHHTSEMRV